MKRLALLLVVGCGGLKSPPDFKTDLGVSFYGTRAQAGWVTQGDADELEAMLVRGLTAISWKWDNAAIHACLQGTEVHMVTSLPCGQAYDCHGTEEGPHISIRAPEDAPCFQAGSYAHELVHRIQGCLFGDADANHTNSPAWAAVTEVESTWRDLCTKGTH